MTCTSSVAVFAIPFLLITFTCAPQSSGDEIDPTYSKIISDDITGSNEFFANGGLRWNITPGADRYADDVYERPTAQTFEDRSKNGSTVAAANEYFGFLDIKHAQYGYDQCYMYFQIALNTGVRKLSDGTVDGGSFGSGTQYGVRFSDQSEHGANGILLRVAGDEKTLWGNTFESKSGEGYYDIDGDVGGPLGIPVVNENSGSMTGFESERIKSDGGLAADTDTKVLWSRILGPEDGVDVLEGATPVVEIAFDYVKFNAEYPTLAIDPTDLQYLVFEANKGLQDNANYLWNDKYSLSEGGSPYNTDPQNIYELDTAQMMGSGILAVPEPTSIVFLAIAGLAITARRRR